MSNLEQLQIAHDEELESLARNTISVQRTDSLTISNHFEKLYRKTPKVTQRLIKMEFVTKINRIHDNVSDCHLADWE